MGVRMLCHSEYGCAIIVCIQWGSAWPSSITMSVDASSVTMSVNAPSVTMSVDVSSVKKMSVNASSVTMSIWTMLLYNMGQCQTSKIGAYTDVYTCPQSYCLSKFWNINVTVWNGYSLGYDIFTTNRTFFVSFLRQFENKTYIIPVKGKTRK